MNFKLILYIAKIPESTSVLYIAKFRDSILLIVGFGQCTKKADSGTWAMYIKACEIFAMYKKSRLGRKITTSLRSVLAPNRVREIRPWAQKPKLYSRRGGGAGERWEGGEIWVENHKCLFEAGGV